MSSRYLPQGMGAIVPGHGIEIVEILESRDGSLTLVELKTGLVLRVFDIAAGRDMGVGWEHISTNISPGHPGEAVDVVLTSEIVRLVDPVTDAQLYPPTE